jgi:hypothetical protein
MTDLTPELLPWRVGRKVGRTIYAVTGTGDDVLVGLMDTRALAARAVADHNAMLDRAVPVDQDGGE